MYYNIIIMSTGLNAEWKLKSEMQTSAPVNYQLMLYNLTYGPRHAKRTRTTYFVHFKF